MDVPPKNCGHQLFNNQLKLAGTCQFLEAEEKHESQRNPLLRGFWICLNVSCERIQAYCAIGFNMEPQLLVISDNLFHGTQWAKHLYVPSWVVYSSSQLPSILEVTYFASRILYSCHLSLQINLYVMPRLLKFSFLHSVSAFCPAMTGRWQPYAEDGCRGSRVFWCTGEVSWEAEVDQPFATTPQLWCHPSQVADPRGWWGLVTLMVASWWLRIEYNNWQSPTS